MPAEELYAAEGAGKAAPAYTARILRIRRDTYVEFVFTAGDPVLSVELVLPYPAFKEFCASNDVVLAPIDEALCESYARLAWRFGDRTESARWSRKQQGDLS